MKTLLIVLALLSLGAPAAVASPSDGKFWKTATSSPEAFVKFKADHDENGWVSIQKISNIVLDNTYGDRLSGLSPEVEAKLREEFANEFVRVTGLTTSTYVATDTFYRVGNTQGGITVPSEARFDAALAKAQAVVGSTGAPRVLATDAPAASTKAPAAKSSPASEPRREVSSGTLPAIGAVGRVSDEDMAALRAKWEKTEQTAQTASTNAALAQGSANTALGQVAALTDRMDVLEKVVNGSPAIGDQPAVPGLGEIRDEVFGTPDLEGQDGKPALRSLITQNAALVAEHEGKINGRPAQGDDPGEPGLIPTVNGLDEWVAEAKKDIPTLFGRSLWTIVGLVFFALVVIGLLISASVRAWKADRPIKAPKPPKNVTVANAATTGSPPVATGVIRTPSDRDTAPATESVT